jgi:hypothetical protein
MLSSFVLNVAAEIAIELMLGVSNWKDKERMEHNEASKAYQVPRGRRKFLYLVFTWVSARLINLMKAPTRLLLPH